MIRPPSYAQLYIFDGTEENVQRRHQAHPANQNLDLRVFTEIQDELYNHNPLIPLFKQAYTIMAETPRDQRAEVSAAIKLTPGTDQRRYNLPQVGEVAVLLPGVGTSETNQHRDIVLRLQGGGLQRISNLHPLYLPLRYPLFFPFGEQGWHPNIPLQNMERQRTASGNMSQTLYYCYLLFERDQGVPTIFWGGPLFQEFLCDAWGSTEQSQLCWIILNQKKIRADQYYGFRDQANRGDISLRQLGQSMILPSGHPGSGRYMYQLFLDSMAICARYFKPDLFITMTCNPKWPEILEELRKTPGLTAADRPDVVVRVFRLKMKELLNDILKSGIFGRCVAHVYTIEFQKRGLPHMHLLIFLAPEYRLHTPADVDRVSVARIPDPVQYPRLYNVVTTCMIHECKEKRCKEKLTDPCEKQFPKEYASETKFAANGYPTLKRVSPEDGGFTHTNHAGVVFTDKDVVPYNPYLSAKYECHINVEVCASISAIKYIHKYIYKGHDRATFELAQDEVKQYLDARYISSPESCWRLFEFVHS